MKWYHLEKNLTDIQLVENIIIDFWVSNNLDDISLINLKKWGSEKHVKEIIDRLGALSALKILLEEIYECELCGNLFCRDCIELNSKEEFVCKDCESGESQNALR